MYIVSGFEKTDAVSLGFFVNLKCDDSVIVGEKFQGLNEGPDRWFTDVTFFHQIGDNFTPLGFYLVFHKKTCLTILKLK